jgi:hypothetical protein
MRACSSGQQVLPRGSGFKGQGSTSTRSSSTRVQWYCCAGSLCSMVGTVMCRLLCAPAANA